MIENEPKNREAATEPFESPTEKEVTRMTQIEIEDALNLLSKRERKVLELRFGLEDGKSRTLQEVGEEFRVTRERIRQIEARALGKLKHPSRQKKLTDYLDLTQIQDLQNLAKDEAE